MSPRRCSCRGTLVASSEATAPEPLPAPICSSVDAHFPCICATKLPVLRPLLRKPLPHYIWTTSTFIFDVSCTLWQRPPSFWTTDSFGNVHLHFGRQLHTLATSTFVFEDIYTTWQCPPSFRRQLHTFLAISTTCNSHCSLVFLTLDTHFVHERVAAEASNRNIPCLTRASCERAATKTSKLQLSRSF